MTDTLYEAWRRPQGDPRGAWQKVPGMTPMAKGDLFAALQQQMWVVSEVEHEYVMAPVGEKPVSNERFGKQQGPFSQTYRTKVMRPR